MLRHSEKCLHGGHAMNASKDKDDMVQDKVANSVRIFQMHYLSGECEVALN